MQWGPDDIIGIVAVIGIVVIPVLGFTARFAVKPLVESMLRIRETLDRERKAPEDRRLAQLEERVTGMEALLERVAQTVEFDARLRAGSAERTAPPAAGPRLMPASGEATSPGAPRPPLRLDPADYEEEYQ